MKKYCTKWQRIPTIIVIFSALMLNIMYVKEMEPYAISGYMIVGSLTGLVFGKLACRFLSVEYHLDINRTGNGISGFFYAFLPTLVDRWQYDFVDAFLKSSSFWMIFFCACTCAAVFYFEPREEIE